MKQNSKRVLLPTLLIALVVLAAAIIYLSILITPVQGNADTVVNYDINDSGLTYGSALEAPCAETEPDLIKAWATNGLLGYVYKKDLDEATLAYAAKNPEEAVQIMENRFMAASFAFIDSVETQTGQKTITDPSEVCKVLTAIFEKNGGELPFDYLTDAEKGSIIQLLPENENAATAASKAYSAACAANDRSIPVYESDGKTVIGEFVVS